jgi:hypothetical protein
MSSESSLNFSLPPSLNFLPLRFLFSSSYRGRYLRYTIKNNNNNNSKSKSKSTSKNIDCVRFSPFQYFLEKEKEKKENAVCSKEVNIDGNGTPVRRERRINFKDVTSLKIVRTLKDGTKKTTTLSNLKNSHLFYQQ